MPDIPLGALAFVRTEVQFLAALMAEHRLTVGDQERQKQVHLVVRRRITVDPGHRPDGVGRLPDRLDQLVDRRVGFVDVEALLHIRQQVVKDHLAVGIAEDETAQLRKD
ncbi:MAG: hypothetical protein ABEK29_11265, partial [Bradymonadaceae bacterium]